MVDMKADNLGSLLSAQRNRDARKLRGRLDRLIREVDCDWNALYKTSAANVARACTRLITEGINDVDDPVNRPFLETESLHKELAYMIGMLCADALGCIDNTPEWGRASWKYEVNARRRIYDDEEFVSELGLPRISKERFTWLIEASEQAWTPANADWAVWSTRSLAQEPTDKLILILAKFNFEMSSRLGLISQLIIAGMRNDGENPVLLSVKSIAGTAAVEDWQAAIAKLVERGLNQPQCIITDGTEELEEAARMVWPSVPIQLAPSGTSLLALIRKIDPGHTRNPTARAMAEHLIEALQQL